MHPNFRTGLACGTIGFFLILSSCRKKEDDCLVLCTEHPEGVSVVVVDKYARPYSADSVVLQLVPRQDRREGVTVNTVTTDSAYPGHYTLISDWANPFQGSPGYADFLFIGFTGGKEVFRTPFVLARDCCHVRRYSGPQFIITSQ